MSLRPSFWRNANEKLNGRDDDGNGYVDDLHGWNFLGTADGKFNMVSAGTEEYRQFKRLYPKYKGVTNAAQVKPGDKEEFAYYLDMRKKAIINSYLTFFEISVKKQQALASADSIVRGKIGAGVDTLTLRGLTKLSVENPRWATYLNYMLADLFLHGLDPCPAGSLRERACPGSGKQAQQEIDSLHPRSFCLT